MEEEILFFADEESVYLNKALLDHWIFSEPNCNASLFGTFLTLLLMATDEENSTVCVRKTEFAEDKLKILIGYGLIDVYHADKDRRCHSYKIVVRKNDLYENVGSDYKPNLPIVRSLYNGKRRSEIGYQNFRKAVLKRDGYKCRNCFATSNLEVHHIKEYVNYPKLRTSVKNGITLCHECHRKQHPHGVRYNGDL